MSENPQLVEAVRNVYDMLRPGGYFLVTTPFRNRHHATPIDPSRWTETGLRYFLSEVGFPLKRTVPRSWGNRLFIKANFKKWARRGWFDSLRNEPGLPVTVWTLARK